MVLDVVVVVVVLDGGKNNGGGGLSPSIRMSGFAVLGMDAALEEGVAGGVGGGFLVSISRSFISV